VTGRLERDRPETHAQPEEVVDLRPEVDREPWMPGDCPACGGPGYLDRIDLRRHVQHQHCRRCDHRWREPVPFEEPADFD